MSLPTDLPSVIPAAVNAIARSHEFIDGILAAAKARTAELGRPVRCEGIGCYGCCKEPVYVERGEAEYIVENVPLAELPTLCERTRAWWDWFHAKKFNELREPGKNDGFASLTRYRAANLWCPLLKEGACLAYANRPLGCRYHLAVSHPKKCHDDAQRPKQVFMVVENLTEVNMTALGIMCEEAPQAMFQFDHLGIWLGHILLGETARSLDATNTIIRQKEPA